MKTHRIRSGSLERVLLVFALLGATVGCGPPDAQIGASVLFASPLFVGLSWGVLAVVGKLWHRVDASVGMRHAPSAMVLAATVLGLLPAFAGPGRWSDELVLIPSAFLLPAIPTALDTSISAACARAYVLTAEGGLYGWPVLLLLLIGLIVEPVVRPQRVLERRRTMTGDGQGCARRSPHQPRPVFRAQERSVHVLGHRDEPFPGDGE